MGIKELLSKNRNTISSWVDSTLATELPQDVKAIAFNLYEDAGKKWSVEIVGTSSFNPDDSDWACDEVTDFGTRENPYTWNENAEWDVIQLKVKTELIKYLNDGKYAPTLKALDGAGVGFVDGDLEILFVRQSHKR